MSRVKHAVSSRKRRKKSLEAVKGQRGSRSKLLRTAKEAGRRALVCSYRDRKRKKADFRSLWIARIGAACKLEDISYNKFISGLKKASVLLNRKMLAEIAVTDNSGFKTLVKMVQQ